MIITKQKGKTIRISLNNKTNIYTKRLVHPSASQLNEVRLPSNSVISFRGNPDFILVNKLVTPAIDNNELKHISDVLKTLGVKELEIGDNIPLARLLKSAMYRVKMLGFDIPSRIKCESKFFEENETVQRKLSENKFKAGKPSIPGVVECDFINDPIMYLNTKHDWSVYNNSLTQVKDKRHAIWHETGHVLHMNKFKNNSLGFNLISNLPLNGKEKEMIRENIGEYAAESCIADTIAEIFARLVSGENYQKLNMDIFRLYDNFKGPMPN